MKILVLCTGNSCRSQMAEGWFRHYGEKENIPVEAFSAGLAPKGVNRLAVRAMNEVQIDISGHTSDPIDKYISEPFDFVITVCDNAAANCPVFTGAGEKLHWPFDDPDGVEGTDDEVMAEFRRVRDEIGKKVHAWLKAGVASSKSTRFC